LYVCLFDCLYETHSLSYPLIGVAVLDGRVWFCGVHSLVMLDSKAVRLYSQYGVRFILNVLEQSHPREHHQASVGNFNGGLIEGDRSCANPSCRVRHFGNGVGMGARSAKRQNNFSVHSFILYLAARFLSPCLFVSTNLMMFRCSLL